jgi:hypothetical protein
MEVLCQGPGSLLPCAETWQPRAHVHGSNHTIFLLKDPWPGETSSSYTIRTPEEPQGARKTKQIEATQQTSKIKLHLNLSPKNSSG